MVVINEWFEKNTFHHRQFADVRRLVEEKKRQRQKISLCIPTLNEEATIGRSLTLFRTELQDRFPLLDEIVVIDSGSIDKTKKKAVASGVEVHSSATILPELGHYPGKGENLWKAVYQLHGDIIVYVDADIVNIHPCFVYGLVAPLLYRPEIKYVKAFYDRPSLISTEMAGTGGGRVTEILVRPLLSLFYPELTAIIQPLSGEYAVRREVLEQIPFPSGYGVELAHLLDVYLRWGLSAFGQTDMENRLHRHRSNRDLGITAFSICRLFLKRLRRQGVVDRLPELSRQLRQFQVGCAGPELLIHEYTEQERPPMLEIEAYQTKFNRR